MTKSTDTELKPASLLPFSREAAPLPPCDTSVEWLKRAHTEQLALCNELEDIADSLPANINRQKCIYAAKALTPLIRGVHHYEESILFPWLERQSENRPHLAETLNRLKFEHCEDECFAEELTDSLLKLASKDDVNVEAIGYMLRGFFEGLRRHIAFEREHLLRNLGEIGP
ncbi:hemerythrin domain-containing protein [Allorhizobium sp. BGMRC 0089]|uniref:hemerythrin domain-containing protein n=1 Tax=Allorhizobium sonneratiae TaxID=2934936 RepID=UPI0020344B9A|nr:hemerythrin domain-containing protein [Allorhizobium sonneratiae]MCM2293652.1 hemerythrin domain-containing protein [Allorhizobium sonneratiae]